MIRQIRQQIRQQIRSMLGFSIMRKLLIALVVGAAACSGTAGGAPDMQLIGCTTDPRAQAYMPGMQQLGKSKRWTFTLLSSAPAPPAKGTNTWTLALTDSGGNAVTGASFNVVPWMPDHGHGTSVVPMVTPVGTQYRISPLYLFMPGLWQVTIDATARQAGDAAGDAGSGSLSDSTIFTFCIQG